MWVQRWWWHFCLYSFHGRVLTCVDAVTSFHRQWLWRCSWAHATNIGRQPCPLHMEIPQDSLNLLMILSTIQDEISKFFAILCILTLFFNCCKICPHRLSQFVEPLLIFTAKRCISGIRFLYPILLLTSCQLT